MAKRNNQILSYQSLERLTRQWWFYLLIGLGPVAVPPFTAAGLGYLREMNVFVARVSDVMLAYKTTFDAYMPAFHLAVALLIAALVIFRDKFSRFFSFLVGIHFLFMLFAQSIAVTERYGAVILSEPFLWYLVTALFWFWEAAVQKTDYTFRDLRPATLWLIPLVLLAFWDPEETWNLDPRLFLTSYSPAAFCMMVPIYLAVLRFQYPRVNLPLFRVTSFMGIVLGIVTLGITFFQTISDGIYWVLLHIPLLAISLHCFLLGLKTVDSSS